VKIETKFKRPIFCGRTYRASGLIALKPGQKLIEEEVIKFCKNNLVV